MRASWHSYETYVARALTQLRHAQHALERTLAKERTDLIGADGEKLRAPEYVDGSRSGGRLQVRYARWAWEALGRWDAQQRTQQAALEEVRVWAAADAAGPAAVLCDAG